MDRVGYRILLVDDDKDDDQYVCELLVRVLPDGSVLDWVRAYDEALAVIGRNGHDVVLIGDRLGDRYGVELIRESVHAGCEIPLILLAGQADRATDLAATEAGAADYLIKDRLDAAMLERSIRYAIRRKRTEVELRRSEGHHRQLFESVPHPMFVVDKETLAILDVNQAAIRHYGYTRDEFLRMTTTDLRPPEDIPAFREWVESHRHVPRFDAGCWRHRRKDGSVVEMEVVVNDLESSSGGTRVVMARDVTEHRRAEEALRRSEQQLRAVFDGALSAMVIADDEGRCTDANPAASTLFGLPREELLGLGFAEFMAPEEVADADQRWRTFLAEGRFQRPSRLVRRDGTVREVERWATAHIVPGRHLSVIRDVTERNHMEEALRQSEERFRGAFAAAAPGMAIVAPDGRFLDVNRSLSEITGYTEAELLATNFQAITHPDDLESDLALLQRTLGGEMRSYRLEKRYIHKQGRIVWVMLSVSLVHGPLGKPLHEVALIEDITLRKEAEARQARLLRQVKGARRRLKALSRRLIAAQEAERRHLARELHDEIGQSLTALKLIVQSVSADPGRATLADEGRQIIDRLIGQVRDLSLDLRPSMLDDFGLVPALRWYISRFTQRTGVTARLLADPTLAHTPAAVETACFRIAQEALTNVSRYASAQHVWVELGGRDGELSLTIRDDGVGFDTSTIWERMARGTGLGLLGMRERAALLGGRIEVVSSASDGTAIRALFPLGRR